jgi:succinoglycan biosynthesis protein ExoV
VKLYFYRDAAGNFGDDLNAWLWPQLLPDLLEREDDRLFVGIGTLLNQRIPPAPRKIVFGAGAGYGARPRIDDRWRFLCVRGPLTAEALGLPPQTAVTDGAALIHGMVGTTGRRRGISFMPHHVSCIRAEVAALDLPGACEEAGVHYIDPCGAPEEILDQLAGSELVLGEAMHACIVADALRIPWVSLQLFDHILPFKWSDWCRSLALEYQPVVYRGAPEDRAAVAAFIRVAAARPTPQLSEGVVFHRQRDRLLALLEELRRSEGTEPPPPAAPAASLGAVPDPPLESRAWLRSYYTALGELTRAVPPEATMILVDEDQWATEDTIAGRRRLRFLERNGQYWGAPADDAAAIDEMRRLQNEGAQYLVLAWPAFWWLDHYRAWAEALGGPLVSTPRVRVFRLGA